MSTQDAFMNLVHYDQSHRKPLQPSSFRSDQQQYPTAASGSGSGGNYLPQTSRVSFGSPSAASPRGQGATLVESLGGVGGGYDAPRRYSTSSSIGTGNNSPKIQHATRDSVTSILTNSQGKVKSVAKAFDEAAAAKNQAKSKEEKKMDKKASQAEKKRVQAARKEQKKHPVKGDSLPSMPTSATDRTAGIEAVDTFGADLGDAYTTLPPRRLSTQTKTNKQQQQDTDGFDSDDQTETIHVSYLQPGGAGAAAPQALRGNNGILVDRELERISDRRTKDLRMQWRVWTGTVSLVVLAFGTYFMARYIIAWLNLSPASIPLSDARDETAQPIDTLVRLLCLIDFSAAAASLACVLWVVAYLRATRRRTCGMAFAWFCAVLGTTLQLALACVNLALIVLWHKQYSSASASIQAATRDVGRRCAGRWDFDLLWNAADASPASTEKEQCSEGGTDSLKLFLMAGGIRLALLVVFHTIWLCFLARYNWTLEKGTQEIGGLEESAEMRKLLEEEGKAGLNVPGGFDSEKTLTNHEVHRYAEFVEEHYVPELSVAMSESHSNFAPVTSDNHSRRASTDRAAPPTLMVMGNAPPKLGTFDWQSAQHGGNTGAYRSVPIAEGLDDEDDLAAKRAHGHGEREPSLLIKVWDSLWGTTAHPHTDLQRNGSKLGVSGWFNGREATIHDDEQNLSRAASVRQNPHDYDVEKAVGGASSVGRGPAPGRTAGHERTPSQERRAQQSRHAAMAQAQSGPGSASGSRDDLPAMPELQPISKSGNGGDAHHFAGQSSWGGSDDSTVGDVSGNGLLGVGRNDHAPQYVRTMGKLVRKLSAIESVGSAERDRSERLDQSQGSQMTNRSSLLSPSIASLGAAGNGHGKRASWSASHGTRLEVTSEAEDEPNHSPHRPHLQLPNTYGHSQQSSTGSTAPFPGGWSGAPWSG